MLEYLDFLFLSYSGRIGRTSYWLSTLVLAIVQVAVVLLLLRLSGGTLAELKTSPEYMSSDLLLHVFAPIAIISVLFLYPTYALATKRCHRRLLDADRTGLSRRLRRRQQLRQPLSSK